MSTIFAVSSGRPPAAIAVLRLSGPASLSAAQRLAGALPEPRRAAVRALRHDGRLLDRAMLLVMPGPDSATGEDVVELHLHGGRAIVAAVERALSSMPGCRRAAPGEFTRRALANGRIDLAEAEGLADLLVAETEAQRRAAIDSAEGRLSRAVRSWLGMLSGCAAALEVQIDYEDEGDDAVCVVADALDQDLRTVIADMRAILDAPPIERLRDGICVVIAGPPNTGKSSLVNAMAGRDVAIVSPIAGTTRDRIDVVVDRQGHAYCLSDTAGLTITDDPIEAIGVELAERTIAAADLILWTGDRPREGSVHLHSRADRSDRSIVPPGAWPVSAWSSESVAALWEEVARQTRGLLGAPDSLVLNQRQRAAVAEALSVLDAGMTLRDPVLRSEHIRQASAALAAIVGLDATEAMLDALFARFCVGK